MLFWWRLFPDLLESFTILFYLRCTAHKLRSFTIPNPRGKEKKKDSLRVGLQRAGSKAKRMEEEKKKKKGDKKEAVLVGFLFFLFVLPFRSTATVACWPVCCCWRGFHFLEIFINMYRNTHFYDDCRRHLYHTSGHSCNKIHTSNCSIGIKKPLFFFLSKQRSRPLSGRCSCVCVARPRAIKWTTLRVLALHFPILSWAPPFWY